MSFLTKLFIFFFYFTFNVNAEILKNIEITGNKRISKETIMVLGDISPNKDFNKDDLNKSFKNLYETNFFQDIKFNTENNVLYISVVENPIIEEIVFNGIKKSSLVDLLYESMKLKNRNSYTEIYLKDDLELIESILKQNGYYFAKIETLLETDDTLNSIKIILNIDLGEKAKIKKIVFLGDKKIKDKKLLELIASEEHKFWKFISNKVYLNQSLIDLDKSLLENFYKNRGYYNVKILNSFAEFDINGYFKLIYNINAGKKYYFNKFSLNLPMDYNQNDFNKIEKTFSKLENEVYSLNKLNKILKEIDTIASNRLYDFISVDVTETVKDDKINFKFTVSDSEKFYVEKINIIGNYNTIEDVFRNNLIVDEGDPFNEILYNKSINNIKSLNFFKTVNSEVTNGEEYNTKILDIYIEEKPTGEISAQAGIGTSGASFGFGVKENNFMGKGISLDSNFLLSEDSFKGKFSVINPNFRNSDKSINISAEAIENDNLEKFGYKSNKTGISFGTKFEYLDDFNFGIGTSNFYEVIETNSTASQAQQDQKGNYWDSFINLDFIYDKRNQKFQTSSGFNSFYSIDVPIVSEKNTLKNNYNYSHYFDLFDNNISTFSFFLKTANSINNKDIKLSERINIPSSKLRGFESGRVGPKDGDDFIGGNYAYAMNFSSTIPQFFEESQNVDFLFFIDAANLWGVDYNNSLDDNGHIRSSTGIGIDWFSPIGPMNFSLAHPITKKNSDKTESFRFNLGTTF